jgi:hypothetical protein
MAKLKLDDAGHAVLENGVPVYVMDDGKEVAIDGAKVHSTLGKIRDERDAAAGKASDLESELRAFGGTPEARKTASEKLKLALALDDKKLVEAGKVDEVVAERLKPFKAESDAEKAALAAERDAIRNELKSAVVGKAFASTKAVEGTILTPSIAEAMFGQHFDVENGAPVAYRVVNGKRERIYSRKDPAQVADFDEALSIQIQSHPDFGSWKKGTGSAGSGAPGGASGSNDKTVSRAQFEALPPAAKLEHVRGGGVVADAA